MFGLSNSPGLFGYRGVLQAQRAVLLDYRAILVTLALDRFFCYRTLQSGPNGIYTSPGELKRGICGFITSPNEL